MSKLETLKEFYESKFQSVPDDLRKEMGHFNVFKLDPYVGEGAKPAPYRRRDYYKITLLEGNGKFLYADKEIAVQNYALVFSNPQIPYSWQDRDRITSGDFCIFDQNFFYQYGNLNQYSLFQPNGNHVFELKKDQFIFLKGIYARMFEEINSDYIHKYDLLRTLVYEMVHFALKMQPAGSLEKHHINASQRISNLFMELLERQFPIDDPQQLVPLRSASDYAEKLNVHVNHLNRSIKEITDKTTSQIIAERILKEAKILLKQTAWTVSEISYTLGFSEPTHFNNFFKKHVQISPVKFRNV